MKTSLLTSDGHPALFAPLTCNDCNGSGTIGVGGLGGNDPDTHEAKCEVCDGEGTLPYPGTYADQRRDFLSEVIGPIEQALAQIAPEVGIMFDPNSKTPYSFNFRPGFGSVALGTYCSPSLESAAETAMDKLLNYAGEGTRRAEMLAKLDAHRKELERQYGFV